MRNLTPHPITVGAVTFQPSGTIARITSKEVQIGTCSLTGVPIVRREFGEVIGLPDNYDPCLVSALVLSAVPNRPGVFAPDTGPTAVRDSDGNIVSVTRLVAA